MLRSLMRATGACGFCALLAVGCEASDDLGETTQALVAVCTDRPDELGPEAWLCPQPLRVECSGPDGAQVSRIYVANQRSACDESPPLDVAPGPFPVGEHHIVVMADGNTVCIADLDVVDTLPPRIEPAEIELWPPNHALHRITVEECAPARDLCDPDVQSWFTYATSDEPEDAEGDGSTEGDVRFDGCGAVELRAERQGGGNGRVYTLGVRAVDASGNTRDGECRVIVPHDTSGVPAIQDDLAYGAEPASCD